MSKRKIRIGDTVMPTGANTFQREFFKNGLKVVKIVKPEEKLNDEEVNNLGKALYLCEEAEHNIRYYFSESQLEFYVPMEKSFDELEKEYREAKTRLNEASVKLVNDFCDKLPGKRMFLIDLPTFTKAKLNIPEMLDLIKPLGEGHPDAVQMAKTIQTVKDALVDGRFFNDARNDGVYIKEAKYRHIGYYNDLDDLLAFGPLDDAVIAIKAANGEGHFYAVDSYVPYSYEEIISRIDDGKKCSRTRWGKYFVVNNARPVLKELRKLKKPDPDCSVFIDVYELVKD